MNEVRKVRCSFSETKDGIKINGWFHMWGLEVYENNTQITNGAGGVVEDDDGVVHMVNPIFIQFKRG